MLLWCAASSSVFNNISYDKVEKIVMSTKFPERGKKAQEEQKQWNVSIIIRVSKTFSFIKIY